MSVQNQIVKNVYEGNGSTTVFPYTFALNETDGEHVKVYIADETEVSTPTDNFIIDTQLRTVTYPRTGAALPEGSKIVIRRELPNEQDTNLENNGAFFAETIEREFDRVVMMIQQLAEQVTRAVKTDMSSVTTPDELIAELRAKAQAAVESASAALVSENNARASEQAAAQSETNAESYKDTTYGYMTTTEAYVSQAETSATTATNKATEASASASAAAQSKTAAEAAADTAYDYMIEAGASESIATQKAENAANSATAAATSEANARTLVNTVNPPWNIRLASTEYAVGDIAYSALLPSWAYIECTTAGTTDSGDLPVPATVSEGATFTDGTVTWKIQRVTGKLPLSGGTMTGDIVNTWIKRANSAGESAIYGGTGATDGALIGLRGATNTSYGADQAGSFVLSASNGISLLGKTDGGLMWDTKPVLYPMATYSWSNGDSWYIGYKYPDGEFIMSGYGVQAANTLGITLTYPIPLVKAVRANATIAAKSGTAYCGLVSFACGTTTVGYFTIREYNYATPAGRTGIFYTIKGRWTA